MRRLRSVAAPLGTLVAGLLVGFVLAAFLAPLIGSVSILGGTPEPPEARAYVVGLMENNPRSLAALRGGDLVSRALEIQTAGAAAANIEPTSLTYLGGGSAGRTSVHIYAVGLRSSEGEEQLLTIAVTVAGGKVVRIE